jgi:two-component system, cell cycle response regulator
MAAERRHRAAMPSLRRNLAAWPAPLPGDGRGAVPVRLVRGLLVAGLLAYTAHSVTGARAGSAFFENWLYNGLLVGAAVLVLLRAVLVRHERAAWLALGIGLAVWAAGVVEATLKPDFAAGGFPTVVDLLWLAYYPAAYAALILLLRARVQRFYVSLWVDGMVGALALSAMVAALAFPALVTSTGDHGSGLLADLSYPVADVLLAGFVLWVGALTEWRPGRVLGLVAGGLLAGALVDSWSLWSELSGHGALETRLDWLWPASAVLLAAAAWVPNGPAGVIRLSGLRPLAPPVVFAASALGLLLASRAHHVDTIGFLLAAATLAAVIARMALTFAENLRMVERSRREALTDALTGLGNRRRLMDDLRELLQTAGDDDPWTLLEFDLDGFKRFNDTFGHPAGDELLSRLGAALAAAAGPRGRTYRLGGDEFCVLVPLAGRTPDAVARLLAPALCHRSAAFDVTAGVGAVRLPAEAQEVDEALRIADQRLYAAKRERMGAADAQARLELTRLALRHSDPALAAHADRVAALAERVGRRLGLDAFALDGRVVAACDAHLRGEPVTSIGDLTRVVRAEAVALPETNPDLKVA